MIMIIATTYKLKNSILLISKKINFSTLFRRRWYQSEVADANRRYIQCEEAKKTNEMKSMNDQHLSAVFGPDSSTHYRVSDCIRRRNNKNLHLIVVLWPS